MLIIFLLVTATIPLFSSGEVRTTGVASSTAVAVTTRKLATQPPTTTPMNEDLFLLLTVRARKA